MNRLPASQAREKFAEILNEVAFGRKRMVLHRHGKDLVAVIPVEDLALLEELEDRADVARARRALADKSPRANWAEVRKELKLK